MLEDNNLIELTHIENRLWTPIRTKPKKEKKLAEYCEKHGLLYYLPLIKSVKRYERKTVVFYPPMFAGYIFCNIGHEIYKELLKSHDIFFKVDVNETIEKQLIIDLQNIRIIELSQKNDIQILIKPELIAGSPIKIISGPLKGATGVIKKRENVYSVYVNIELLGQCIEVNLDIGEIDFYKPEEE